MEHTQKPASLNARLGLGRHAIDHDQIKRASEFYAENVDIRGQMATLLNQWNFGLSDVRVEKLTVTRESGETPLCHNICPVF